MAKKGQLNAPVESVQKAFKRAIKAYSNSDNEIAIFMIGGKISSTSADSPNYKNRVDLFESSLIGIYDIASDARHILDDIEAYYKAFPGVIQPVSIPVFRNSDGGFSNDSL
jgi:F0F1-type ATP synthase gamma subunit